MAHSGDHHDAPDDGGGPATRQVPVVELLGDQPPARRPRPPGPTPPGGTERPLRSGTERPVPGGTERPLRGGGPERPISGGTERPIPAGTERPLPAGTQRASLRHRVLPRSLLGITALILSFAIGAGLSGVVLYSYYQYRLNQTNQRVNTVITGYKQQFANAEGDLRAAANAARSDIQAQLGPIQALEASPATLARLAKDLAPSMFFVHTLDSNGQASVGSAFVISSDPTQSLLLTSYTTVAAATRSPAPVVYVQQGATSTPVTVRTWDPSYDLALVVLPQGHLPALTAAPTAPAEEVGGRLYAVSGLGSAGAALSQGIITDVSANGIQHDAPIGQAFQGGPLVNEAGQVVAISSRTYAPLGFATDSVWYAPYVQAACNKVLTCPGGSLTAGR